jgi:hypothetical protein
MYDILELIHNLQHNYNIQYIVLNYLFLDNIDYISRTRHFEDILRFILLNHKQTFINNYKMFIDVIAYDEKYIQICKDNNIQLISMDEATSQGDYDLDKVQEYYNAKFYDYDILWF